MFYNVSVAKKAVDIIGDNQLVRNNKKVDYIQVTFDKEWDGIEHIFAMWSPKRSGKVYPMPVINGISAIPFEATDELGEVTLNFTGRDVDNESLVIVSKLSNKPFEVVDSGYFKLDETSTEEPPTADVLASYLLEVEEKLKAAQESGAFDGTTFIPSVDAAGNLSWSNADGKKNPATVNIKGVPGSPGKSARFAGVQTHIIEDGGTPNIAVKLTGSETDRYLEFEFYNLKGVKGDQGDQGDAGKDASIFYSASTSAPTTLQNNHLYFVYE